MNTKIISIFVFLLLVSPVSAIAGNGSKDANIIPIEMELSGAIMDVGLFEYEGALKDLKQFELSLKGSPGSASARGVGWAGSPVPYNALPPGNLCYDIPSPVDGVMFEEFQMTMSFKDGSLLFANAVPDTGYVCFAPSIAIGTYEFNGGTKRFKGAKGWANVFIETFRFNEPGQASLVTAETGTLVGEVIIP